MESVQLVSMKNVRDIFTALGGVAAVGRIIGKGSSTVSEMIRRNSVGVDYWPRLIAAAPDEELAERDRRKPFVLTNDDLANAHHHEPELQATG